MECNPDYSFPMKSLLLALVSVLIVSPALSQGLVLDSAGRRPEGTVRVPGGPLMPIALMDPERSMAGTPVAPYWLERYEVTNRDFAAFVEAHGYEDPRWWPPAMERDGEVVTWLDHVTDEEYDPESRR